MCKPNESFKVWASIEKHDDRGLRGIEYEDVSEPEPLAVFNEQRAAQAFIEAMAVAARLRNGGCPHPASDTVPPRIPGEIYPYANINLTSGQLRRLPMYVRHVIARADAEINKAKEERHDQATDLS